MSFKTIPEMFNNVCDRFGDTKSAYLYKIEGEWTELTFNQLRDKVQAFALGLMELGIHKGDRVGLVAENRIEWIISSLAINAIGAIDVPIFPILTSKQEEYIFTNCSASAIIVSNNFQLGKVMEFKERLTSLRHIIVINKDFKTKDVFVKSMDDLINRGAELRSKEERREIFKECCDKISEDDTLTIIYTSGTTGNPKGVMLTHKNVVSNINGCLRVIGDVENEIALSYLPFCHSYERTTGFYSLLSGGATVAIAESIDSVAANLKEVRPTFMTTVPKLLETVKKKVYLAMDKESSAKRKIFNWAVSIGTKYVRMKEEKKSNPIVSAQYKLADKLVFSKLRERIGGRLKRMVSGGAALTTDVAEFFFAMGVAVYQGYGLTEASPVLTINDFDANEMVTIGKPLYNVELKLAADGEILARGPNIMKGYWDDPTATQEAIDADGWLYTGDVAVMTEKGNYKITDRKKYIFVSSGGKNIAPQPIENLLSQSRYIEHCVLIGERREYCTALLTPNFDQLKLLANEFGIEYSSEDELIANQRIVEHIKKDLDHYQKDISKFERVRKFSLLSKPFSVENGELSPKMSIKRYIVERNYAAIIEKMYGED